MGPFAVKDLLTHGKERLNLSLIGGYSGTGRTINSPSIKIFDMDQASADENFGRGSVVIITHDVLSRCEADPPCIVSLLLPALSASSPPLIVCSQAGTIPPFLIEFSNKESIPLCASGLDVFPLQSRLIGLLREKIENIVIINGVLVEVLGIGVVIIGESGIGKSECGLELVTRGHKLIADDIIEIRKGNEGVLAGLSMELTKFFMEIRGLGIINVKRLFGVAAVSDETTIHIMVEFIRWKRDAEFDRIESEEHYRTVMGVKIPLIRVPVRSGGNMATIVEIVARNEILRKDEYSASRDLKDRIFNRIQKERPHR
ncbi:MAG TPA: HPr(Ser) kinase/phosphatase [Deltaproteobacteria bacterium]|nr:HPr(Ser) kinase/phosphatase [Deltaproteobacteria bacterium]